MKKILFIQHGYTDKPGLLANALESSHVEMEVLHPYAGDKILKSLDGFAGLAIGGGAQSAYEVEKYPYLADECALIREAVCACKPVLGLCLGAQLMVSALGGSVRRASRPEIGFFPVTLNSMAEDDPLWHGLPREFITTHWHSDACYLLPPECVCLGFSEITQNQLLRFGDGLYGFQFHLEMTPELFGEMVNDSVDDLAHLGIDPQQLQKDAYKFLLKTRKFSEIVFARWVMLISNLK